MFNKSCMHCYISGKVQGVWYRASAREEAMKLGLQGWAKNLADGRVEVYACGDSDQLDLFYAWLQKGPKLAVVTECSREELPWEDVVGFFTR